MFTIKEDIGYQKQNPIKKIIAHINEYINNKAANRKCQVNIGKIFHALKNQ